MGRRRDRVAFIGMMMARLGGTLAVLLGIAALLDYGVVMAHMAAGLLLLVGVLVAAARYTILGRPVLPVWAGLLVLVAGTTISLGYWGPGLGLVHAAVMLLGFGRAEMGSARARRA
jgi:hypothetical protein